MVIQVTFARICCHGFIRNEQVQYGSQQNHLASVTLRRFVMRNVKSNQPDSEKIPPLRILVVDDDLLTRRMMQVLLGREGHQVDVVSNGLEAFDVVKFQRYDIVFMDLFMPVMDGLEASCRIREWENEGQHTFIVALTASYLPEEGYRLFEAGIDNYIPKPFELAHIEQMLRYSIAARSIFSTNQKVTFPPKLSSKEILDIQNGVDNLSDDLPILSTS
jgi:CheY-like chemotaxis protein